MLGVRLGKEAFGDLDGKIEARDALVDFLPQKLSRSVTLTQSVGTYRRSSGLLPDIVEGAAHFAVEHPVATALIVGGIKARHDSE